MKTVTLSINNQIFTPFFRPISGEIESLIWRQTGSLVNRQILEQLESQVKTQVLTSETPY